MHASCQRSKRTEHYCAVTRSSAHTQVVDHYLIETEDVGGSIRPRKYRSCYHIFVPYVPSYSHGHCLALQSMHDDIPLHVGC